MVVVEARRSRILRINLLKGEVNKFLTGASMINFELQHVFALPYRTGSS